MTPADSPARLNHTITIALCIVATRRTVFAGSKTPESARLPINQPPIGKADEVCPIGHERNGNNQHRALVCVRMPGAAGGSSSTSVRPAMRSPTAGATSFAPAPTAAACVASARERRCRPCRRVPRRRMRSTLRAHLRPQPWSQRHTPRRSGPHRLGTQQVTVYLSAAQSIRAVPDVKETINVRTREHRHALLSAVTFPDSLRVAAGEVSAVGARTTPGPAGRRVVGAGTHTARPIWRLSQSESHWMAFRPALSTMRVL